MTILAENDAPRRLRRRSGAFFHDLGRLWGSKADMHETFVKSRFSRLGAVLGRSWARFWCSKIGFGRPKGPQDTPKTLPRDHFLARWPQEVPKRFPKEAPRGRQRRPKRPQEAPRGQFHELILDVFAKCLQKRLQFNEKRSPSGFKEASKVLKKQKLYIKSLKNKSYITKDLFWQLGWPLKLVSLVVVYSYVIWVIYV